jgi:hypothetical protein
MARVARDLEAIETNEAVLPGGPRRGGGDPDDERLRRGWPPLAEAPEPPELEFYRRARTLGLEHYIEHWAREWDVLERWEQARRAR